MTSRGLFQSFDGVWLLDGVRTPMVDHCGAFAQVSPTDMGIKVAREVLARTGIAATEVDSVLAGSMAPGGFDQFYLPRHIGLYASSYSARPVSRSPPAWRTWCWWWARSP